MPGDSAYYGDICQSEDASVWQIVYENHQQCFATRFNLYGV